MGDPKNGWCIIQNPVKLDDVGYPYFRKETIVYYIYV